MILPADVAPRRCTEQEDATSNDYTTAYSQIQLKIYSAAALLRRSDIYIIAQKYSFQGKHFSIFSQNGDCGSYKKYNESVESA